MFQNLTSIYIYLKSEIIGILYTPRYEFPCRQTKLTIGTFVYCISDWICRSICAWITRVLDIGVIIIYGITTGWVDCENTTNSKTSCTWTFAWTSIGRAFTKIKCVKIKEMKILLYFRPSTYLEVKQVPFRYDVEPLLSWLVLTHGSFLKLTIVNREKTWTKNYVFNSD